MNQSKKYNTQIITIDNNTSEILFYKEQACSREWKSEENIDYKNSGVDILLTNYLNYYMTKNHYPAGVNLNLINFGSTELVYLLSSESEPSVTLLVKQPSVQFGKVKQEADYLLELKKIDNNVIAPIDYYSYENQELYVTPYIDKARCIGCQHEWGIYIPEQCNRFVPFTNEQVSIVNSCMIAKLVSYYNFETLEGISSCNLGGGDFMLSEGWEIQTPTIENTLNYLYFIAAREKVKCSFDVYLKTIINEFSKKTIGENQESLKINLNRRVSMKVKDVEKGIELGKKIINIRSSKNINEYEKGFSRVLSHSN